MLIGGGGFIGRALTQEFLNSDNFVITWCTARDVSNPPDNIHIVNDLLERSTHAQDALLMDVDVVFYLASNTTPSTGATDLAHEIEINLLPFSRYLTALIRQPDLRLIYLSSGGSIYDPANPLPATESAALCAQSCYASGKIAMETFLTNAYRHSPTDLMILRPSNIYGPGQLYKVHLGSFDLRSNVFARGGKSHSGAMERRFEITCLSTTSRRSVTWPFHWNGPTRSTTSVPETDQA